MSEAKTRTIASAAVDSRRQFVVRGLALLAATLAPGCKAEPQPVTGAPATPAPDKPMHHRSRGTARISVTETGARGDGVHDDTAAFQRAIDSLTDAGGTVEVPPGRYLIDAVKSVRLRDRMHLQLAGDATLVAKPNDVERAYVLYAFRVDDVEISGGRIIGEREAHRGTAGEWGHGIQLRGASHVTIRDMHISDCWGDGICAGTSRARRGYKTLRHADDIVIARVVSTGNRRQGLSLGGCRDVKVFDSEFSDTHGTSPQCGIDIEPERPAWASRIEVRNCLLRGNAAYGILVYKRTRDVVIEDCTIEDNRSCGVVTVGTVGARIEDNIIRDNGSTGVFIKDGSTDVEVAGNTFHNNYDRQDPPPRQAFSAAGASREVRREILVSDAASAVRVAVNHYR